MWVKLKLSARNIFLLSHFVLRFEHIWELFRFSPTPSIYIFGIESKDSLSRVHYYYHDSIFTKVSILPLFALLVALLMGKITYWVQHLQEALGLPEKIAILCYRIRKFSFKVSFNILNPSWEILLLVFILFYFTFSVKLVALEKSRNSCTGSCRLFAHFFDSAIKCSEIFLLAKLVKVFAEFFCLQRSATRVFNFSIMNDREELHRHKVIEELKNLNDMTCWFILSFSRFLLSFILPLDCVGRWEEFFSDFSRALYSTLKRFNSFSRFRLKSYAMRRPKRKESSKY